MNLPSVVILGRPNVGKSSLFNRILGRRQAIVDDAPGITRDRIYAQTEWRGRPFALIDTGGMLPGTKDPIIEAVREQVEFAAQEATRILFVVDWETGVTDLDQTIARYLHRLKKDVLVVINKADTEVRERDPQNFPKLGFDQIHFVSAMRGYGIGDLLDAAVDFPEAKAGEPAEALRIAIVGRPNVGKSSMVNALTGQKTVVVSEIAGTTRDSTDTPLRYQKQDIILVDTAGLKRRGKTKEAVDFYSQLRTSRALERAEVVWVVMDATIGLVSEDQRIISEAYEEGKGVLLLMNKWDAVTKDHTTMVDWEKRLRVLLGEYGHLPMLFVSALERQRLLKALDLSLQIGQDRVRRLTTSQLNNALLPVIARTPPPSYNGRFIKIKYITQLRTAPPLIGFFCNIPAGVAHSYRRFLEKTIRQQFGFSGVPLRLVFRKK
ncbi:MAG: ribosome biogenesis GTPase Der [Candidatus Zixiibacteriota bacterium]|nr:MAG: ribosome biogenesis GTPase Der [candidate division Zixibacteria bacterium]